jgi:DNA-binding PadR family transcriptional regulator
MKQNRSIYNMLTLLSKNPQGLSGYDIKKRFASMVSFQVADCNSQIYPVLQRLKKEGLIEETLDKESGKRQRTAWTITKAGLSFFKAWLKEPAKLNMHREDILLKVQEPSLLPAQTSIEHLEDYLNQIEAAEQTAIEAADNVASFYQGRSVLPYIQAKLNFSKHILAAKKQWAKETITFFEKMKK